MNGIIEDPEAIVIVDCGSTTTKAILIEKVDGFFRQTFRGEAPTTVETPLEDVTIGVKAALTNLWAISGRRIIDESGHLIRPSRCREGIDLFFSTSSAGGGLQMIVAGIARALSATSAKRAALGAGAIVADSISLDDSRNLHEQVEVLRRIRPDMVLLAGGTDRGAQEAVVELAQIIAAADPRPRFGEGFNLPLIFAGNMDAAANVETTLPPTMDVHVVENVRPTMESENLASARDKIHGLFLEHVMKQAPGFANLVEMADAPVMPTPSAVGAILLRAAADKGINVLAADIGGATTDIFSVVDGAFTRTVSANLGVSYSAAFTLKEAGPDNIARWLGDGWDRESITDALLNKTMRPTTIPDSLEDLYLEQALAREALRMALDQHREFAVGLKGTVDQSKRGGGLSREKASDSLVDMRHIDLVIGSGGVLSHAPRNAQTAAMIIDSFQPQGVTRIAKDSVFMMPHLGVLSQIRSDIALSVFERDCMEVLCTCVAPLGNVKTGKVGLVYRIVGKEGDVVEGEVCGGTLSLVRLDAGDTYRMTVIPKSRVDLGYGPNKRFDGEIEAGELGVVFDLRGRPMGWNKDSEHIQARCWRAAFDETRC